MDTRNLRNKIFQAIQLSTYNKEDPDAPSGHWSCWIHEHGVYGEQMQTQFCLNCGEYVWLTYQQCPDYHHYRGSAPSEPSICQCVKKIQTNSG